MAQPKPRLALDLDEIERQLNQAQLQAPPSKADPLAELARIVGQDDPFRTLLNDPGRAGAARPHAAPNQGGLAADAPPAPPNRGGAYGPVEEDDLYPSGVEDLHPLQRRRSRKGLIAVGAVLGSAVMAVAAALTLRGGGGAVATGEPPVIAADRDPLKVKPENPGGVSIPNQNAQVYERERQDATTRVVNREEQPSDIRQVAGAGARSNAPALTPSAPVTSPIPGLGEPRRVRTVSVRPDGTIIEPSQTSAAPPATSAPQVRPNSNGAAPALASTPAAAPALPQRRTDAQPPSAPAPGGTAAATTPSRDSAPLQISPNGGAAAKPARTAAVAAQPPASDPVETSAAGFVVQVATAGSEQEARSRFQALQRRFASELAGQNALVRSAEVNGKTVYRVRVGPLSRDDANSLCSRLKTAGGECFVARN